MLGRQRQSTGHRAYPAAVGIEVRMNPRIMIDSIGLYVKLYVKREAKKGIREDTPFSSFTDYLFPCLAGKLCLYQESVSNVGARSNTLVCFSCAGIA